MHLRDIQSRLTDLTTERLRLTNQLIEQIREQQQQKTSAVNELTLQSLEHRRRKLLRK